MVTPTCLIGQSNLFRAGLKRLLSGSAFEVAREISSARQLPSDVDGEWLFLLDEPEDAHSVEADINHLKEMAPEGRVVLLAETMEAHQLALCFSAGTDGYLLEEISPEALLESLHLVMLGEKVFPSRLALLFCKESWTLRVQHNNKLHAGFLSEREIEIVSRLAEGLPNKVIANELTITEATVKVHLKSILKKLGAANRTQAAIWAVQNGLAATSHPPDHGLVVPAESLGGPPFGHA